MFLSKPNVFYGLTAAGFYDQIILAVELSFQHMNEGGVYTRISVMEYTGGELMEGYTYI
jgi:hypothetical protein